ncbi:PilW family protein [Acinetobacter junii]|uniref:PilW family protein n=1 Tax=Acinetobacter junii TaxID=40215 RepID=UPI000F68C67D|nr:PilW family protein [Acinetobacter junii]MDH1375838.1 PilW family protein [Acinetobacter junii]QXR11034.1 PilW family protein [Acinetobacter junii]
MSKQLGMTLIELMVALALGLIITAAGVQLFVSGTINYSLQKTLGELQDNGNFGLNYIAKDIRLANLDANLAVINDRNLYSGIVLTSLESYSGLTADDKAVQTANLPLHLTNADTTKISLLTQGHGQADWAGQTNIKEYKSDQLVIQYKAIIAGAMDCEGSSITQAEIDQGTFIVQRYFLRKDGNELALACDAGRYKTLLATSDLPTTISNYGGNGEIIMRRVDHFHVLLGVKDNSKDEFKYMSIKDYMGNNNSLIKDGTPRNRIMSVQLGILMRGVETIPGGQDVPETFQILDQSVSLNNAAKSKRYIREVVTQTIALRNGYGLMESL